MGSSKRTKKAQPAVPSADAQARTLFICVRDRNGKGASCAGSGARELFKNMRAMLAAEEIGADELTLRPCSCLGLCKQGPVLVAASGPVAREKKPPKPKKRARSVYTKVAQDEAREVLRAALLGKHAG